MFQPRERLVACVDDVVAGGGVVTVSSIYLSFLVACLLTEALIGGDMVFNSQPSLSLHVYKYISPFSGQALFNAVRSSIDGQADRNETEIELTPGAALASSMSEFGVVGVIKHRHKSLIQLHNLESGQVFWVCTIEQPMARC